MNAVQEWLKEESEFFAPANTDAIDGLVGRYRKDKERIKEISSMISDDSCISYFIKGNCKDAHFSSSMFDANGAIKALNSDYWGRALAMTDVIDSMNNDRRQEWYDLMRGYKCPEFEESTVRATIQDLLLSRNKFFAERVDGIFRNLSGEHVTNSPMGFRKRMIISGVHGAFSYSYKQLGYISDLRVVIAKFMGREPPKDYMDSNQIINIALKQSGNWIKIDGGALRIRVYLKGTAHLEIHPDMAWRLNCVLAQLYPNAIPSEFRKKPEKRIKEFDLIQKPLPFAVINLLAGMREVYEPISYDHRPTHRKINNALVFDFINKNSFAMKQAETVMESIGGVKVRHYYQFDYNPKSVIDEIVASGCIPDHVSHQYYPTPENIARDAVEIAEIGEDDICLEPSAGQGWLADYMPKNRTVCVEISDLHCKILEAKGYSVTKADFLNLPDSPTKYQRIVMNPPYSDGRWQAHLGHAFKFLANDGILVAILPASAKGKELIKGAQHEFSHVYENEFSGTSVSVVIAKIRKA